jgi:hypothetical protein
MPSTAADHPLQPHPNGAVPALPPAAQRPRSFSEAVAAVRERALRTEMRRVRQADASKTATVTLPRAAFDAMQRRLHEVGVLQRLLDDDAMMLVALDTSAPHTVREVSRSQVGDAMPDIAVRGRPLTQWFGAADALRVQRALAAADGDLTTTVELRQAGRPAQRHLLHLLPPDPMQSGFRSACLVRLPDDAVIAEPSTTTWLAPTKPALRPQP